MTDMLVNKLLNEAELADNFGDEDVSLLCVTAARRIEDLEVENAICRDAIEHALEFVDTWADDKDDDHSQGAARAQTRMLNEAIGKAVPRLLGERPEGQRLYGLHYRDMRDERDNLRSIVQRLPHTADGVPVIPDLDSVWVPADLGGTKEPEESWYIERVGNQWVVQEAGIGYSEVPVDKCYSTRDAALAANDNTTKDTNNNVPNVGDYVLATKWGDGDPKDEWAVGFFVGMLRDDRYLISDADGKLFRANGFRRAERISENIGTIILNQARDIEQGDVGIWELVSSIRSSYE